ncbi:phosphoribosylamine--glycine ligase [bacterium]|nr:phosphoribosylamine--glycine ligase [bacterium]
MKVLVIGSGGREHAIVWKLSKSPLVDKIYCAPSNGGINLIAEPVNIKAEDIQNLVKFASEKEIGLTVVGPENPLSEGIVDIFQQNGLTIFGPSRKAARIESSKVFSKSFMKKYAIPTADFEVASDFKEAELKVHSHGYPIVIKADGLAAGKGVFVCNEKKEGQEALEKIFKDKIFGDSGNSVVIEDKLVGEEATYMVITDGRNIIPLSSSQDHKAIYDGDKGPNTGGMGAYSPAPIVTKKLEEKIISTIVEPTITGLKAEGFPFCGLLFTGLMIKDDNPFVIEFNCRFGDPEAQVVLMNMESDLFPLLMDAAKGDISGISTKWSEGFSVCVVIASKGYPRSYEKGKKITGLEKFVKSEDVFIFHAGTKEDSEGNILTNGGRVLGVTAIGKDIKSAIAKAYSAVLDVSFENVYFRRDIGQKALNK